MSTRIRPFLLPLVAALLPGLASAAPFQITSTPTETSGSFRHNVFHTSSASGGQGGSILAYFDLDPNQLSLYDPDSGMLDLHVELFSDAAGTNGIGTAVASSSDLVGSNFRAPGDPSTGSVAGTITWTMTTTSSGLNDRLDGDSQTTMTFLDQFYVTSALGYEANSWDPSAAGSPPGPALTLWGADSWDGNSFVVGGGNHMGMDLVLITDEQPIPEPSTFLGLATFGLIGAIVRGRRQRA